MSQNSSSACAAAAAGHHSLKLRDNVGYASMSTAEQEVNSTRCHIFAIIQGRMRPMSNLRTAGKI
eukprot:5005565-Pleurochrysis_carterae.AAC.1